MGVMLRRMLTTERTRLVVLAAAMVVWFLLMMVVYNEAGLELFRGQAFDNALGKGFDLRQFASADNVLAQLVGLAYTHPLFLVMMSSVVVALGARSCAGELDAGTLELTLSRPLSRSRYLLTYWLFIVAATAVLLAISALAALGFASLLDVPGTLHAQRIGLTALNAWLMFSGFGSLVTLVSTLLHSRSSALFGGVAMVVAMYFLTFFARVWEPMEPFGRLSLFDYFPANDVMLGNGIEPTDAAALVSVSVVAIALAIWRFEHRDLV